MPTIEFLKSAIGEERLARETFIEDDLPAVIRKGECERALETLIYYASPKVFLSVLDRLQADQSSGYATGNGRAQQHTLQFLAGLTLALRSFLPHWNLQNYQRYGEAALTDAQVKASAARAQAMAVELAATIPAATQALLDQWQRETRARLAAEQCPDPKGEAEALTGSSMEEYLENLSAEITSSHLRRMVELRNCGQSRTEFSNDYAAFLPYALYLGASFATTNPPLVNMAWSAEPDRWDPVADQLIARRPDYGGDALARLMTLEVVLAQMRMLRPIFLLTEGQMGCVCLQVPPDNHSDAAAMIADAQFFYNQLIVRLQGGAPNVVFKLPGTLAGLEACRALTAQGIGVTVTVNFGMFQHIPFAQAIQEGQAIFSCLVEMNGRLAYPVRDELLRKLDKLAAYGIDEAKARQAAAYAGVAVAKRLHKLLVEKGYNLARIKPLIASLRYYEGDGYRELRGAFPDITETVGAGIISVFPNIRRYFDKSLEMELNPCQIDEPLPVQVLEALAHSEIFKQAYYVADRDWVEQEEPRFRPERELTLEDERAVAGWAPVNSTLSEFIKAYQTTAQRLTERKQRIAVRPG